MKAFLIFLGLSLLVASTTANTVEHPKGGEKAGGGGEGHCLKAKISRKCERGSGPIIFNDTE